MADSLVWWVSVLLAN